MIDDPLNTDRVITDRDAHFWFDTRILDAELDADRITVELSHRQCPCGQVHALTFQVRRDDVETDLLAVRDIMADAGHRLADAVRACPNREENADA